MKIFFGMFGNVKKLLTENGGRGWHISFTYAESAATAIKYCAEPKNSTRYCAEETNNIKKLVAQHEKLKRAAKEEHSKLYEVIANFNKIGSLFNSRKHQVKQGLKKGNKKRKNRSRKNKNRKNSNINNGVNI